MFLFPAHARALLLALLFCLLGASAGRAQVPVPETPAPAPAQNQTAPDEEDNAPANLPTNADTAAAGTAAADTVAAAGTVVGTVAARRPLSAMQRRQQTEDRLRALMMNLGLTAAATQDAVIEYLAEDEMGRSLVRDAEKRMLQGVRRDVPPERMRDLIGDYKAALDSDKIRRATAQNKLNARVGYSLAPKLEAMLWLMGVLGEGASKLPTGALVVKDPVGPTRPDDSRQIAAGAPVYGPPLSPSFGARGEIVGTVTAKGVTEKGEHWLEIRDDSGALDRYSPLWRDDLGTLDPEVDAQLVKTPLGARVRVQWLWQERRRALQLAPETAPRALTAPAPR